jgi:energy-converting hydrogenase A subunit M
MIRYQFIERRMHPMAEKFQVSEEELFQVLEKKLMDLLSERENLIHDKQNLSQKVAILENEKKENVQKLEVLISLFNSIDTQEKVHITNEVTNAHINVAGAKPVLVQA